MDMQVYECQISPAPNMLKVLEQFVSAGVISYDPQVASLAR